VTDFWPALYATLLSKEDLDEEPSYEAMRRIMAGEATGAPTAEGEGPEPVGSDAHPRVLHRVLDPGDGFDARDRTGLVVDGAVRDVAWHHRP
jgi:hypothetical protein